MMPFEGTGDKIPQLGLGTWLSEENKVYEATKTALDEGYRHIDEAWIYGNEEEVGRALTEKFAEGKIKREETPARLPGFVPHAFPRQLHPRMLRGN